MLEWLGPPTLPTKEKQTKCNVRRKKNFIGRQIFEKQHILVGKKAIFGGLFPFLMEKVSGESIGGANSQKLVGHFKFPITTMMTSAIIRRGNEISSSTEAVK